MQEVVSCLCTASSCIEDSQEQSGMESRKGGSTQRWRAPLLFWAKCRRKHATRPPRLAYRRRQGKKVLTFESTLRSISVCRTESRTTQTKIPAHAMCKAMRHIDHPPKPDQTMYNHFIPFPAPWYRKFLKRRPMQYTETSRLFVLGLLVGERLPCPADRSVHTSSTQALEDAR